MLNHAVKTLVLLLISFALLPSVQSGTAKQNEQAEGKQNLLDCPTLDKLGLRYEMRSSETLFISDAEQGKQIVLSSKQ
ncbi:MAG: hypothetical protein K2X27_21950 [Candidatus Obscuribacterales bacterium]|nr:hypothetical protein [Candidatus Obscuribacterales bacterium]